jgi:hypothetical protein
MSKSPQTMTQNHSHPVKPTPGVYRIAYNRVANGTKIMPSKGKMKVSKAASTRPGLRIQKRNSAKRGKNPAISASRQPMLQPPSHFDSAYGQVRRPFDQENELNTSTLDFLSFASNRNAKRLARKQTIMDSPDLRVVVVWPLAT